MRLSMMAGYGDDPRDWVRAAPELERAGLDMLWLSEAYSFDAVSTAGALAAVTERLEIGTGILNVFSRTAALLAMTAASLDTLSGGRFTLGIGTSGPQVVEGFHGQPFVRPVDRVADTIDICRTVWARRPLTHAGRALTVPLPAGEGTGQGVPLKLVNRPLRERIPILVASMGPRAVRLTARAAEGWMPMFFVPEKAEATYGPDLAAGRAERAADLPPLDIVAGGIAAVDDSAAVRAAEAAARNQLALYVGGMGSRETNFYHDLVCRYGFADAAAEIQDHYLGGRKVEAARAVPAELVAMTSLIGSSSDVAARVAAHRAAGVTTLCVSGVVGDRPATVRRLRALVDG